MEKMQGAINIEGFPPIHAKMFWRLSPLLYPALSSSNQSQPNSFNSGLSHGPIPSPPLPPENNLFREHEYEGGRTRLRKHILEGLLAGICSFLLNTGYWGSKTETKLFT